MAVHSFFIMAYSVCVNQLMLKKKTSKFIHTHPVLVLSLCRYVGCTGCDTDLKEALSLREWLPPGHTSTHTASTGRSTTAGRALPTAGRGSGRAPPTSAAPGR